MKRLVALILLALALAGALWLRDQNRVATFDWDWRGAPLVPGSEVRGLGGAVAHMRGGSQMLPGNGGAPGSSCGQNGSTGARGNARGVNVD